MHKPLFFAHRFIELLLEKRVDIRQAVLDKNFLPYINLGLTLGNALDENRVLKLENRFNSEHEKEDVRVSIHFLSADKVENGILLWGEPVKVTAANKELSEKRIITYDTTSLPQLKRAELVRRLFGYKTKKNVKDKEIIYEFESLFQKLDGKRLRNAILLDEKDANSIVAILKEYNIPVESSNIFASELRFIEK